MTSTITVLEAAMCVK